MVAQSNAMAALMDFVDVAHACKKRSMLSDRLVVMVAGYEMDLTVQMAQIRVGAAPIPVTEIAKMLRWANDFLLVSMGGDAQLIEAILEIIRQ